MSKQHSKKRTLWLLMIMFSLPVWVAYYLSQHIELLQGLQTTNYGVWVKSEFSARFTTTHSRPWQLVLWQDKACDEACFSRLNQMAKIRLAMGRKLYLLNVVLVVPKAYALTPAQLANCQQQDIQVTYIEDADRENWQAKFLQYPIVLFDSRQQALLMYPADPVAKKLYHDLQQLIK